MTIRKKMTKLTAVAISLILTAGTLASCGASENSTSNYYNVNGNNDCVQENINGTNKYEYNENNVTEDGSDEYYQMDVATENAEELNTEEYNSYTENEFLSVADYPLSTFSTDVDTASYSNVRRMIENRETINADAVRTEEFINYFNYDYPQPEGDDKISITTELTDCPWNENAKLMMIGLQAKEIETQDIDSNIVFLIDVSGSMSDYNKLPLVQQAFTMLAGNLSANDRVSIVTYAGSDQIILAGESGANQSTIVEALNSLKAGGSTAGAAGINTAYELAEKCFIEGGNNRIILATDGDLNVGVSTEEGLTQLIEQKRDKGIFLSVLGFGTGNYKDNKLEALADNGNGNYAYIDSVNEAERVLVTEFSGTMYTVAKDAKVQVEFNPSNVEYYRLVGYENRLLNDEDFEDDTKDAGDIGSGQQVTVLYEIITTDSTKLGSSKTLKYQTDVEYPTNENTTSASTEGLDGELLTVSVRYKEADQDTSKLIDKAVTLASYKDASKMSDNLALSTSLAMFAKTLKSDSASTPFTAQEIKDRLSGNSLEVNELLSLLSDYEIYYE